MIMETPSGSVLDRWAEECGTVSRKIVDVSEPHAIDLFTGLPMEMDDALRRRIIEARRGVSPAAANGKGQSMDPIEALQALRTLINVASQSDDIEDIYKVLREMRGVVNNALPRDRPAKKGAVRVVEAAVPDPVGAKSEPPPSENVVPFVIPTEKA